MDEKFYLALILMAFVVGYSIKRATFGFYEGRLLRKEAARKREAITVTSDVTTLATEGEVRPERPRSCRADCFFFDPENGHTCFCGAAN